MGDEYELHAIGHLAHDIAEARHVVLIERCIDLIEQAERCRVQIEYREHQRDRGQRLLASRELRDRAVALARWARHDRNARGERIIADELQIGVTAAEQARKFVLQAGVDTIEGVVETRARLPIHLAHGLIEGVQCIRDIGELTIQIGLALVLRGELIDRGQIDLAELFDVQAQLLEPLLPGLRLRVRVEIREHGAELTTRSRELLEQSLASHARGLGREPRLFHGLARRGDALQRAQPPLLQRLQLALVVLERAACIGELAFDLHAPRELILQA